MQFSVQYVLEILPFRAFVALYMRNMLLNWMICAGKIR